MTSHIVYEGVPRTDEDADHHDDTVPQIFAGQKLWFHHQTPQRKWLIDNAKLYGATVVDLDKQADVRLVDHAKKNNAPGTHSYRYVERSIRKGRLENLSDHAVGVPRRVGRPVGSTTTAPRLGTRMPYTPEEDQFLWNWMKPFEARGGQWKGNEIYKQIEQVNPRHTWQSWRDRWLKITRFQKRDITSPVLGVLEQPEPQGQVPESSRPPQPRKRRRSVSDEGDLERVAEDQGRQHPQHCRTVPALKRTHEPVSESVTTGPPIEPAEGVNEPSPQPRASFNKMEKRPAPQESANGVSAFSKALTADEQEQLYHMVPRIRDIGIEGFQNAWKDIASSSDYSGHAAAEEWKRFFIQTVVPDYCRKNGLSVEEVAPYLSDLPDEEFTALPRVSDVDKAVRNGPQSDSRSSAKICSNCFIAESDKWQLDSEGKQLCKPCARFLLVYGVPRPSLASIEVNVDKSRSTLSLDNALSATSPRPDLTITTPVSSYVDRAAQTSPIDVPDHPAPARSLRQSPPPKSPSFQPESPTLERRPEPNEARKRSAGRGTQSQSTESTNNPESQALPHDLLSSVIEVTMGDVHSTERAAQHEQHPAAHRFEASSKGRGDKRLLFDDPTTLKVDLDSSLSTDRGPPRKALSEPQLALSEDAALRRRQTPTSMTTPGLSRRAQSPLFVPEDEEDNAEDHFRTDATGDNGKTAGGATSPPNIPDEDMEGDDDVHHDERSHRTTSETGTDQYETGQESAEAWETAPEDKHPQRKRRATTQELFDDLEIVGNDMDLHIELPEPEGGWDAMLASAPATVLAEDNELSNLNDQKSNRSAALATRDQDTAATQDRDSQTVPYLLPSPPPASHSAPPESNADGDDEEASKVDDWVARQKYLHPHVNNIDSLLFRALESTTFDLGLATRVVDIMLAELRRRNRRRRSHMVMENEIVVPQEMKGVWTEEDDNHLTSTNTRDIERVLKKHGPKGCDARFEYLHEVADA